MNKVFEELFKYGFHDTEITNVFIYKSKIEICFDKGLYLLDDSGKETILTEAMILILNINNSIENVENCFEIREYGSNTKYIDFVEFQKQLKNGPYFVSMNYYSEFNNSILFDGGFIGKQMFLSIEEIENIQFVNKK